LSQTSTFLFVLVLHLAIDAARYPGNKLKLFIAGTGSMAKQTEHFCYLVEAFTLEGEVDFRARILGCRVNVAPEEVAKLIDNGSEVLNKARI